MQYKRLVLFSGQQSPFSQFYRCKFHDGTNNYLCAEQYMMSQKALLFNDEEKFQEIMKCIWPSEMKKKGRKIKNFNQNTWDENKYQIVYTGNYYKFTQDQELFNTLLASKGTTLVEASEWDKIWGIGLNIENPDCYDQSKWKGQNLLGYCLTQLRDYLISELEKESTSQV